MTGAIKLRYRSVDPIGTTKVWGHLNRGDQPHMWGPFELPAYPESTDGRRLFELRRRLGLGLRESAAALGLTALQMSSLERGAATCDWEAARTRLEQFAELRREER